MIKEENDVLEEKYLKCISRIAQNSPLKKKIENIGLSISNFIILKCDVCKVTNRQECKSQFKNLYQ